MLLLIEVMQNLQSNQRMRKKGNKVALFFLLFSLPAFAADITGKVVSIADGDTLTILTSDNEQVKVRVYGIDAPERTRGQAYWRASRENLADLCAGQEATLEVMDTDRYKRTVAVVRCQGQNAGLNQVINGYAWAYTAYLKKDKASQLYREAEDTARQERRGLWQEPNPIPPWDWRRNR